MQIRVSRARTARAVLANDYSRPCANGEEHARQVGGSVAGNWQYRAACIDTVAAQRRDLARRIWRCAVMLEEHERDLSDEEWSGIAERFAQALAFSGCPWTVTRRGVGRVFITFTGITWDGRTAFSALDLGEADAVRREVESRLNLAEVRPQAPAAHQR